MNKPYITTMHGGSGWFAVLMSYYEDIKGYDVTTTGIGRFATKADAIKEAKYWVKAEDFELEYRD